MKSEFITEFLESLTFYSDTGFIFDSLFISDLKEIISKNLSGNKKQFFNLLTKQLNFVNDLRRNVDKADGNEKLKNTTATFDLYSLHLNGKNFNIRFLITFDKDDTPLFLVAFYERSGKRYTGYSKKIEIAIERYKRREKIIND